MAGTAVMTFATDFVDRLKGMRVLIPFTNERPDLGLEVVCRFKISDMQAFALEDAETTVPAEFIHEQWTGVK